MANRTRRVKVPVDYAMLNAGTAHRKQKKVTESEEEELDYMDDVIDIHGESELTGGFLDEEEVQEELEEGECETDEDEKQNNEIRLCMETGNLEKLKKILKQKEEKCKRLQQEVKRENSKEAARKEKEM